MVLSIKNFNILGVHWNIRLLGWGDGGSWGGLPKKGAWTVCWFKGGFGKNEGGGGEGLIPPMHIMSP